METEITAALIGIASALITAFITKSTADKKNAIENITQERKNWRDDLRGATIALRRYFENKDRSFYREMPVKKPFGKIVFHSAAEAKAFFEVRLNLGDPEDCKLMAILDRLVTHDCSSRKPTFQKWEAESKENGLETEKMLVEDLLAHFEEGMSHNLKYDWERAKKEIQSNGLMRYFTFFVALLITSILFSSTQLLELRYQEITVGRWLYFISLFALIVISIVGVIKYIVRLLAVFQDKYLFGRNKFTAKQLVSDIFGIAYRRKIEPKELTKKWNLCIFLLLGLGILVAYGMFSASIVSGLIEIINLGSKM